LLSEIPFTLHKRDETRNISNLCGDLIHDPTALALSAKAKANFKGISP